MQRRSILRNRNVCILFSGQWVSQMGNNLFTLSLAWYVLSVTHSRLALGIVTAAASLSGLVGLLSGTVVDRLDRKRVMIASDIIRGSLSMVLFLMAILFHLILAEIVAVVFLMNVAGTFFGPAQVALIPKIVERGELVAANGINTIISSSSQTVGLALGGLLIGLMGPALLFLFNAVSFLVSVLTLGFLKLSVYVPPARENLKSSFFQRFWIDFIAGYQVIWADRLLRRLVFVFMISNFAVIPVGVLDVAWVRQILRQGAWFYGLFEIMLVVGVLVGGVLAAPLAHKLSLKQMIFGGIALAGLSIVSIALLPFAVPNLASAALFGISVGSLNTALVSALQMVVPEELMGRVAGTSMALTALMQPLGALVAGIVAGSLHLSIVFLVSGVLCAATAFIGIGAPDLGVRETSVEGQ
ncbi:MAG: MFS transporter [Bacilli bacterium]